MARVRPRGAAFAAPLRSYTAGFGFSLSITEFYRRVRQNMRYASDLNMTKKYKSSWWAIEHPSNWSAEEEKDCVTLSAKHGVGALQISAYRRADESVTDEDLNDLAEDELTDGVSPQNASCGDFNGIAISYVEAERFWRKLWLRSGSLLLYVTYSCGAEEQAVEVESVNRMLSSLKSRISGEA